MGRWEEALEATQEAVGIYRELAASGPEAVLPDLANSLSELATLLSEMGRWEEALGAAGEAVRSCRQLAEACPDAYLPDLALSLRARSLCLRGLERSEEALADLGEGIRILTPCFSNIPVAHIQLMGALLADYLALGKALRREPDAPLLAPALRAFARLRQQTPD